MIAHWVAARSADCEEACWASAQQGSTSTSGARWQREGALDKRGDPEEPFKRRPDFDYLGNFTSCLSGIRRGRPGTLSRPVRLGRLLFQLWSRSYKSLICIALPRWNAICQRTRRLEPLPETRFLGQSTVQGPIPVQLH